MKHLHQKLNQSQFQKTQAGAVLIEALMAVLIFSFGLLALAGLQAAMIKNTTDANYRAEASLIAQQQLGAMWGDINNLNTYVGTTTVASLPSGSMTVAMPTADKVEVRITWQQPGESQHNYEANAYILKGCPTCT